MEVTRPPEISNQKTATEQNIIKSGSNELRNDDHTKGLDENGLESNEQITEQCEKDQQANISKIPILKQKLTSKEGMDILPKEPHRVIPKGKSVLDKLALFENEVNKGKKSGRLVNNKKEYGLKSPDKKAEEEITDLQHRYNNIIESVNKKDNDSAYVHNTNLIRKLSTQEKAIIIDCTSKHNSLKTQKHNIKVSENGDLMDEDVSKNIVVGSGLSNDKESKQNDEIEDSGITLSNTNLEYSTSKPEQRPLQRSLSVLERKSAFENNFRLPTARQFSLNIESKPIQYSEEDEVTSLAKVKPMSAMKNTMKDIVIKTNNTNTKTQEKLKPKIIKEILKTDIIDQEAKDVNHLQENSSKVCEIKINNMQIVENHQSEMRYSVIVEQNGEATNNGFDVNKKQNELFPKADIDLNIEHDITSQEINITNNNESNEYNMETAMKVSVASPKPKTHDEVCDNQLKSLQYTETKKQDIDKRVERRKQEKPIKVKEVITNIEEGRLTKREHKPPIIKSGRQLKRELSVSDRIALFETLISRCAPSPAQQKRAAPARP